MQSILNFVSTCLTTASSISQLGQHKKFTELAKKASRSNFIDFNSRMLYNLIIEHLDPFLDDFYLKNKNVLRWEGHEFEKLVIVYIGRLLKVILKEIDRIELSQSFHKLAAIKLADFIDMDRLKKSLDGRDIVHDLVLFGVVCVSIFSKKCLDDLTRPNHSGNMTKQICEGLDILFDKALNIYNLKHFENYQKEPEKDDSSDSDSDDGIELPISKSQERSETENKDSEAEVNDKRISKTVSPRPTKRQKTNYSKK